MLRYFLTLSLFLIAGILLNGCADLKTAQYLKSQGHYEEAQKHFTELSDFGIPAAQVELARMYIRGQGTPPAPEKAIPLLQKAADQGEKKAFYELGRLYAKGNGVPQDGQKAASYFEKAIALGYSNAGYSYGQMLEQGKAIPQNIPKAMELYHDSARNGYGRAALHLGQLSEKYGITPSMGNLFDKQDAPKDSVLILALYYAVLIDSRIQDIPPFEHIEKTLSAPEKEQAKDIAYRYYTNQKQALSLDALLKKLSKTEHITSQNHDEDEDNHEE